MDKGTNSFNIAIYAINFINAIFLFIFSDVLDAHPLFIGIVGVILFILNAVFLLILLIMVIVLTAVTFFRKNPDALYHSIADDRASFMKSQAHLSKATELEDLAATARGSGT
ncbi:transient receptor potential (TRP) ion channel domain-containing protein [Hirsutella rhossiliensis]